MTVSPDLLDQSHPGPDEPGPAAPVAHPFFGPAVLATIVVATIVATFFRQGAFYPVDAFSVTVLSVPVIVLALRHRFDRQGVMVTLTVSAFAVWWLIRSITEQNAAAFLPLGTSVLGFLAAFLVLRSLSLSERRKVAYAVTAIGAVSATVGLIAVVLRWSPLAAHVHGTWRVATTLTHPDAAATLFVLALLVAFGVDDDRWFLRAAISACMAGLIATQSPWALLGLALGCLLVPRRRWPPVLWPLVAGVLAGLATVTAAGGGASPWWAWPVLVVAVAVGASGPPWRRRRLWLRPTVTITGLLVVVALTAGIALHGPWGRPPPAVSHNRFLTWSAAADAWRSSKVTGVGPERVYNSRVPVSTYPGFEPDSYLTVTADGGLIGALLLLGAAAAIAFAVRRHDVVSSCAVGALVAFVVAGTVDFDWQLPALGLIGGCVAGLASLFARPPPDAAAPSRSAGRTWRSLRPWSTPAWIVLGAVVVVAEMVVGDAHIASAGIRTENFSPPPSVAPQSPARLILQGPDATDPFMLHVGKLYYLFTSEGDYGSSAYDKSVPVWIGTRIGHWAPPVDALPFLPAWASAGATWAPDVRKVTGGWALYFSAVLNGVHPETHCIGAAFARGPAGPFDPEPQPLICQRDHRGSIDARTYVDAQNQLVMYWKSEDNANPGVPGPDQDGRTGIWAQHLSADGRVLLGPAVEIYQPDQPWEGTIIEAPDVIEVWGTYWLIFSANWYNTAAYGIGVAACQTAFGPCTDPTPQAFLGSNAQGSGPGEPSIWNDGQNVYLLYNPWHSNDPLPTPPRPVAMARIGFRSSGPDLATPPAP